MPSNEVRAWRVRRWVLALIVVALVSIADVVALTRQVEEQHRTDAAVALASRRALLIERVAVWAGDAVEFGNGDALIYLRLDLDELHGIETRLAALPALPVAVREIERDRPYVLASRVRAYCDHASRLLAKARPGPFDPDLLALSQHHDNLVALASRVAAGFVDDGNERQRGLVVFAIGALAVVLVTLALEALFIFWPMERRIRRDETALRERVRELDTAHARLRHQATHDPLTGLENRSVLGERLTAMLAAARERGRYLTVAFLDLDDLKEINDAYGHAVGDLFLRRAAERLRATVGGDGTLVRAGGDEFVALLEVEAPVDGGRAAERLITALRAPLRVDGRAITTGASVGVALAPLDGDHPDDLLRAADTAMYVAKRAGGGTFRLASSPEVTAADHRAALIGQLRAAVAEGAFALEFQPIVDRHQSTVAVEALVRWRRPGAAPIGPDIFVPIAEECGLVADLDAWVIREATRAVTGWRERGLPPVGIAINLSGATLASSAIELIAALLAPLAALTRVEVEVTESAYIRDLDTLRTAVTTLRGVGCSVAIDDFGTGYGTFAYMKRLAVDALKIDQSFVRGLPWNAGDAAIVRAVIALAASLGLTTVAEGIETREQFDVLRALGCDRFQGYAFARPLPADALEAHLLAGADRDAAVAG